MLADPLSRRVPNKFGLWVGTQVRGLAWDAESRRAA